MPRQSRQTFNCQPLEQLARQLLFAPPDKRAAQLRRAERLHDEIDAQAAYPLDYLVYRITQYRRYEGESVLLAGQAIAPDLRLLIDRLSGSIDLPLHAEPGTRTVTDLARQLNVSTKTVRRWRDLGLRWRWIMPSPGGRKQMGFTPQAVERFTAAHPDRVQKAAAFTQLTSADRRHLITRARRIVHGRGNDRSRDVSLNQVAAHLARKTGRALETIRQLLETHDRDHPQDAIFHQEGPLTPRQKRIIARAHRMGVSVSRIAERFHRSRPTIYRVINDRRAAAARRLRLSSVSSPMFDRHDADEVILRGPIDPYPSNELRHRPRVPVDDLPAPLRPLYHQSSIEERRQRSLFIRFNYLKYKASRIRDHLAPYNPRAGDLDAFERCVREASQIRDLLVKANLPAVLSVARRHLIGQADRSTRRLLELLELGVPLLIESVDAYNATRSQPFESFLTNRLMRQFAAPAAASDEVKARRRISARQLLRRMIDQAGESGVALTLDDKDDV